ncbi:MAG: DNA-directed RNA polymerase subunit omega [Candidatus Cloacimonadota bacterium]|nr:MAG: DNA-directed RNA polymerase subunit omega [Candidatus Cloacimonadota bacterium]
MIIFDIDKVQRELDGKFNLSHLIVNRVKKLKAGVESKVERKMREKEIILAIREIDSGELVYARDETTTRSAQVELSDSVIIEDN